MKRHLEGLHEAPNRFRIYLSNVIISVFGYLKSFLVISKAVLNMPLIPKYSIGVKIRPMDPSSVEFYFKRICYSLRKYPTYSLSGVE